MKNQVYLFFIALLLRGANAAECEDGFLAYKDELCIKAFTTNVQTYDEAQEFCSAQSTQRSRATLAIVKTSEMQEILTAYMVDMYDNLWLGAKYDAETSQFRWNDGSPLTITNWAGGHPRNTTDVDRCIQLRPPSAKHAVSTGGNWEDTTCLRRNVALCQRTSPWTPQDVFDAIVNLREKLQVTEEESQQTKQELRETKEDLEATSEQLQLTRNELVHVKSGVVPAGSIYIEYYGQSSPRALWPNFTWQEVTSGYAGLFFRALGGSSADWGVPQTDCAPRLTNVEYTYTEHPDRHPSQITLPADGWSEWGQAGEIKHSDGIQWHEGLRYYTTGCNVRPKNMAVRIWRRTA